MHVPWILLLRLYACSHIHINVSDRRISLHHNVSLVPLLYTQQDVLLQDIAKFRSEMWTKIRPIAVKFIPDSEVAAIDKLKTILRNFWQHILLTHRSVALPELFEFQKKRVKLTYPGNAWYYGLKISKVLVLYKVVLPMSKIPLWR